MSQKKSMRTPGRPSRRAVFTSAASTLAVAAFHVPDLAASPFVWESSDEDNRAANDRIQIGVIGLGSRGFNLIDAVIAHSDRARIIAICDVDRKHYRDRPWGKGPAMGLIPAKERIQKAYANQKSGGGVSGPAMYSDFRPLVQRDDIDAVIVATPDHWHALCTMTSLRAGKDVYCEKPVTHFFAEGERIHQEVARRGAVFQTGSQQRSDWRFRRAVELVRNGLLGQIESFEVGLPPGYSKPQGDSTVTNPPETLDYDFWCGPAPKLPYMRARHHRWWRGHRAFGGGVLMDWIGHHNDIAHWAIGADQGGPQRVEAIDWKYPATEVYNTPQDYTIRCEYSGGIVGTISSRYPGGLKLIGTDGWVIVNRGVLKASDPRWTNAAFDPGAQKVQRSDDHMLDFLDAVVSRRPCIAPAETAHRSITPGHLGYVSNALGRPLRWDPKTQRVIDDPDANQQLRSMPYRHPWSL